MNRYVLYIIIAVVTLGCSKKDTSFNSYLGFDIPEETFETFLNSKMSEYDIPGLAIAVINDGKVVYHQTKGLANIEKQLPVTEHTIFEGASISKSVFGFFVMTFVEEGVLDLDKPLYQYMEYPDIAHDERYKKITARMVLCHRSGFPNWREDNDDKQLNIKFDPGTDYFYSGEGYQYLTKVLIHLLDTNDEGLEAEFQKRIAIPSGMEHTVFIQNKYTRYHKAEPYDKNGDWIDWRNDYWNIKEDGKFYAPSSIHSEPLDFSKWMITMMNKEILSSESYKELLQPQSPVPYDGIDVSYTLGFLTIHVPFTDLYLHSGNNEGFTSWYTMDVEKDWGFILFTNSEYGEQLGQELFFYMLADPGRTKLYIILGVIVVFSILVIIVFLRFVIRKVKNIKKK
ncbi:beta-lactamase family protein [Aquimarina sp. D1M17]|uniref:serine hydrolase domain-containing protein n=1 Tax=Aquimarina acroporae TaxID=2937283 RepID=UPI0020BDEAD4|nr:serine hydrolase domain-containing protein [Aquimarina acroporae]MCK8522491.1 beta-lactamase family protein [Aquimarina acroporae]